MHEGLNSVPSTAKSLHKPAWWCMPIISALSRQDPKFVLSPLVSSRPARGWCTAQLTSAEWCAEMWQVTVADRAVTWSPQPGSLFNGTAHFNMQGSPLASQSSKWHQMACLSLVGQCNGCPRLWNRCTTWGIWRDRTTLGFSVTFLGSYFQMPVPDDWTRTQIYILMNMMRESLSWR